MDEIEEIIEWIEWEIDNEIARNTSKVGTVAQSCRRA